MRRRIWREKASSTVKRTRHEIDFFQADGGEDPPSVPKGNSENNYRFHPEKRLYNADILRSGDRSTDADRTYARKIKRHLQNYRHERSVSRDDNKK